MPSPIAHTLAGIAIARVMAPRDLARPVTWYAAGALAANAADFDIVAGLLIGRINVFHGMASHSIVATLSVAAICAVPASRSLGGRARIAALVLVAYGSHVILDLFCGPPQRIGLPLLWPFSNAEFMFPWLPFRGVIHGPSGGGITQFVAELLSLQNLMTAGFELVVFVPVVLLAWFSTRRTRRDA
jgi:membrane-bound metal-dependent hydrolase YbcI (DUF457 family)